MTLEGTAEQAVASVGIHSAATADDINGEFSEEDIKSWIQTAVNSIESETREDDEEHTPK
jgi:hypothetical protein